MLDYKKICEEIIGIESELIKCYYNLNKDNIDKLKDKYMEEQFYFLSLDLDYGELNSLCEFIMDGNFDYPDGEDKLLIIERVTNILSNMTVRKSLEDRMRAYIPSSLAIDEDSINRYCVFRSVYGDYYEYKVNRLIETYPTLEYLRVISKFDGDKDKKNNELVKEAYRNYLITSSFLESFLNGSYDGVSVEKLNSDQENSRLDPYIFYATVHKYMEDEAFDLTGIVESEANDFLIDLNMEKLKEIIKYLDVSSLNELRQNFVFDKEVINVIENEILTRNEYIKGKAEYYEDTLLEENELVTNLLDASLDLLNYYEEISFLEMMGNSGSDKFIELTEKIHYKQNEELSYALNVLDDIKASELMETILFSKSIRTYYEVANIDRKIDDRRQALVTERLQKLLEHYDDKNFLDDIDNDDNIEVDFSLNDEALDLYLKTGFDLGQPLSTYNFYQQSLCTLVSKGLDNYIDTIENKEYFISLKYLDLFVEPLMDKIAVENKFDFKNVLPITDEYLSMVSSMENVSYDVIKNSLAYFMEEYAKNEKEKLTDDPLYNEYIWAKINAVTDVFPNKTFQKKNLH